MTGNWDTGLPVELLALVAAAGRDLKVMRLVSTTWKKAFELSVSRLKTGAYSPALPVDGELMERFPQLTSLDVAAYNREALEGLQGAPLTKLVVNGSSVYSELLDEDLECLASMPLTNLKLDFSISRINGAGLRFLQGMPLTSLRLQGCRWFTDETVELLRGLPLRDLCLGGCTKLTNAAMLSLKDMPLTSLDLRDCLEVSSAGLDSLRGMSLQSLGLSQWYFSFLLAMPLRKLEMRNQSATDGEGLELLQQLPSLRQVSLSCCQGLTQVVMEGLRGLPLTDLDLTGCEDLDDAGLDCLQGMPLTSLDLRWNQHITNAGLDCLTGLPLRSLNLSSCGRLLSARRLECLRGMQLTSLCLSRVMELEDADLENLQGMQLASLDLSDNFYISTAGLGHLKEMPLTSLKLRGCYRVTDHGLECLQQMPLINLQLGSNFSHVGLEHIQKMSVVNLKLYLSGYKLTSEILECLPALPLSKLTVSLDETSGFVFESLGRLATEFGGVIRMTDEPNLVLEFPKFRSK